MLRKFFGMFKPTKLDNPYFGTLLFVAAARGQLPYWEGRRLFAPLGQAIEVFIDTVSEQNVASDSQRDFFGWVENDYRPICLAVEERFRSDIWAMRLMRGLFEDDFALASVSIPLCRQPKEEWSISFESVADPEHLFTITMVGLDAGHISVDG